MKTTSSVRISALRVMGSGGGSERPTGFGSSSVGGEAPALDQEAADRAADDRGDDEAEGGHGDADLGAAGEAAGGELGRPGDDRAVAAEERGGAEDHAEAERQPGDPGGEAADEVLHEEQDGGEADEDGRAGGRP